MPVKSHAALLLASTTTACLNAAARDADHVMAARPVAAPGRLTRKAMIAQPSAQPLVSSVSDSVEGWR